MNSIEGALFTYLTSQPTITAYVGGAAGVPARIYPVALRQPTAFPALSYNIVNGQDDTTLDGGTLPYRAFKRIQISSWSTSITTAKAIMAELRLLLTSFVGSWDDVPVAVVAFKQVFDQFDHVSKVHHSICHITLWHGLPTS